MDVLIQYQLKASKKEPYGTLLRRIHDALLAAPLPVAYEFAFSDPLIGGGVSAVARAVKKFPHLAPLVGDLVLPGVGFAPKMISGRETDLPFAGLVELADGLPRSLPFNSARVRFTDAAFGTGPLMVGTGIDASDSWWVNGRQRSLLANFVVPAAPKPAPQGALAVCLASLGKPSKINRFPMTAGDPTQAGVPPQARAELVELSQKYRAKLPDLVAEAGMPHSLPGRMDALRSGSISGPHPLKPTLERYFKPLGFSCKGGSGTFSLRRRTPANHVVEVDLDVGTWSRMVTAQFRVHVPGYRCSLPMPVAPGMEAGQYPIGDADRWDKIVANLAVLGSHLDRQIVPEIDAVAGTAPEWFDAPQ